MKPLKRFVALDSSIHDRQDFDCGKATLNAFLAHNARRGMAARTSFTWVLPAARVAKGRLKLVCAYYTLSVCHLSRTSLPQRLAKSLPRYPLPAFVLAQLAVDLRCQGEGLGEITLVNALRRCAQLSHQGQVPAIAVIIDVLDDEAMNFYRRFDDLHILAADDPSASPRLYIPIKVVEQL